MPDEADNARSNPSQALMNRSLLCASDPWLATSPSSSSSAAESGPAADSYPPELVTFLVRAQVAVAHPTAEGKVRLVDFGGLAP